MVDLACLAEQLACEFEALGLLADVTFKRLNEAGSNPAADRYAERYEYEKVYDTWQLKAVVDENPKKNVYGAMGGEVTGEYHFFLYGRTALGGTRVGETYTPLEKDLVAYRGLDLPVVRVERILPSGADSQMAFRVMARRFD